jgi:hypothetical protein
MIRKLPLAMLLVLTLSACSPTYDWRDYRSPDAPYSVLFPGKPATQTRPIRLDQLQLSMTMTATEIDGVVFAIGSAQLADAAQGPAAIEAMKRAMVNNIGATITSSKTLDNGALEIQANGNSMRLSGRFIAKGPAIYQVVVIGPPQKIDVETVETFFSSFKIQ